MKIQVLKDSDGDYWLPYSNGDRICLTREGEVDGTAGPVSPDLLAVSEYGPFTTVTIEIIERTDPSLTCNDCLYDKHFCYKCDDAVSHGHSHDDD